MFKLTQDADEPGLTAREKEILELVACGLSAKQIAQEIDIAPRTVERHVENCRHKLRARNKTHLIAKAVALGELTLGAPCPPATGAARPVRFPRLALTATK